MSYDEDEEIETGFRMGADDDEPLEPEVLNDFGLDEEDPDKDRWFKASSGQKQLGQLRLRLIRRRIF